MSMKIFLPTMLNKAEELYLFFFCMYIYTLVMLVYTTVHYMYIVYTCACVCNFGVINFIFVIRLHTKISQLALRLCIHAGVFIYTIHMFKTVETRVFHSTNKKFRKWIAATSGSANITFDLVRCICYTPICWIGNQTFS